MLSINLHKRMDMFFYAVRKGLTNIFFIGLSLQGNDVTSSKSCYFGHKILHFKEQEAPI